MQRIFYFSYPDCKFQLENLQFFIIKCVLDHSKSIPIKKNFGQKNFVFAIFSTYDHGRLIREGREGWPSLRFGIRCCLPWISVGSKILLNMSPNISDSGLIAKTLTFARLQAVNFRHQQ